MVLGVEMGRRNCGSLAGFAWEDLGSRAGIDLHALVMVTFFDRASEKRRLAAGATGLGTL